MPCSSSLVVFLADVNYFTFNITLNWFHEIFWNVWNFVALSLLFWLTLEEEPNLEEFQNKARRNLFSETSHETSYLFLTERHTLKRKPLKMKIFSNFVINGPIWKISKLESPWHVKCGYYSRAATNNDFTVFVCFVTHIWVPSSRNKSKLSHCYIVFEYGDQLWLIEGKIDKESEEILHLALCYTMT